MSASSCVRWCVYVCACVCVCAFVGVHGQLEPLESFQGCRRFAAHTRLVGWVVRWWAPRSFRKFVAVTDAFTAMWPHSCTAERHSRLQVRGVDARVVTLPVDVSTSERSTLELCIMGCEPASPSNIPLARPTARQHTTEQLGSDGTHGSCLNSAKRLPAPHSHTAHCNTPPSSDTDHQICRTLTSPPEFTHLSMGVLRSLAAHVCRPGWWGTVT